MIYSHFRRSTTYRGTRRRREDDRITVKKTAISCSYNVYVVFTTLTISLHINSLSQRPVPLAEVKVSPPKFDLAATNFPPLPGCVISTQGEPVLENRMSDVVRGLYRDKVRGNPDCNCL